MRHEQTGAERKFWQKVRDRRLDRHKFKRQYSIGPYIVDFICLERRLIVELDGGQHATQQSYDAARDAFLAAEGFQVLRLWNHDVLTNMEGVLVTLLDALRGGETPSP
jgi:very-short-patch-repair endonuclease